MKLRYWLIIWGALLTVCIAASVITQTSYTKLSSTSDDVLNSFYNYSTETKGFSKMDYNTLAKKAQLIVTWRFGGVREIQNECYLSCVTADVVIKGDKSLAGKPLKVYEPVDTEMQEFIDDPTLADIDVLEKKFSLKGKKKHIISFPWGTDNCNNYAMMQENKEYLLFLNKKVTLSDKKSDNYVMYDSPYSKLAISDIDAAAYKKPPNYISFKESMQYEILLKNDKIIKIYFNTKSKILKQLSLL